MAKRDFEIIEIEIPLTLKMSEKDLQRQVVKFLKKSGVWFYHPKEGKRGTDGLPDIIGCCNGKFFAIELKTPERKKVKLRKEQVKVMDKIKEAGGFTLATNKFEDVVAFINLIRRI